MKKLSLLISLILCVTIGGVYATWQYANTADTIEKDVSLAVGMEYEHSGAAGTFAIEMANSLTPFIIDQESTTSYKAVLRAPHSIYLTFTPNANSTDDIVEKGIDAYFWFTNGSGLADYKYGTDQIFTYSKANGSANAMKIGKIGTAQGDTTCVGVFSKINVNGVEKIACDITSLLVDEVITLGDFTLTTFDDFTAFKSCLTYNSKALTFALHVTNINPNA